MKTAISAKPGAGTGILLLSLWLLASQVPLLGQSVVATGPLSPNTVEPGVREAAASTKAAVGANFVDSLKRAIGNCTTVSPEERYSKLRVKDLIHFTTEVASGTGRMAVSFVFDFNDLIGITPEGRDGWVTFWVDASLGVGTPVDLFKKPYPSVISSNMGFIPTSMSDAGEEDPARRASLASVSGRLGPLKFTVGETNPDIAEQGGFVSGECSLDTELASVGFLETTFNLSRGEIRREVVNELLGEAFTAAVSAKVNPVGQAVAVVYFADLAAKLRPAILNVNSDDPRPTLREDVKSKSRAFTSSDDPVGASNLVGITGVEGGIDVNGDGWGDRYVPPSTAVAGKPSRFYPVKVTFCGDTFQPRKLYLKVLAPPSGWTVEALSTDAVPKVLGDQTEVFTVRANECGKLEFQIGASVSAQADASVRFQLLEDRIFDRVLDEVSVPFSRNVPRSGTAPSFLASGIVNSASYQSGAVAPGEIVTMFGSNLGPDQLVGTTRYTSPFPKSLVGIRVLFDGDPAPLMYVSRTQLGAVVPYSVSGRSTTNVQVESVGILSSSVAVPVVPAIPGLFTANSSGKGQGAILNEDYSANSATRLAKAGSVVMLYVTGEGQTNPPGADGAIAAPSERLPVPRLPVSVSIGGARAEVLYAGAAPGLVAGVMQVNAKVPSAIAPSSSVPVTVTVGAVNSQQGVTLAVAGDSPSARLSTLTLSSSSVTGGNSTTGTVTLTAAAPAGGTAVALDSSDTSVATVPASVTVQAGQATATFTVTAKTVAANQQVVITAKLGSDTRTATLTVTPGGGGGGAIGYYPFDGSGEDHSGLGRHAIVSGPIPATDRNGRPNGAYHFGGGTDSIRIPAAVTNSMREGTISLWLKLDDTASQYNIFAKQGATADVGFRAQFGTIQRGLDTLYFTVVYEYPNRSFVATPRDYGLTSWHAYTFTWSSQDKKIYLDGQLLASFSSSVSSPSSGDLFIGRNSVNDREVLRGSVDDLRIFDRALNANEVLGLYDVTPPPSDGTTTGPYNMQFVAIPAGEFMMGCSPGDSECESFESPRHRVQITKSFEMGQYEVTQAQWEAVMGSNPSYVKGATLPVEQVSWNGIQQFLTRLNGRNDGYRYRLPTEAEWEYAARAGSTDKYAGGVLDEIAWYLGNSSSKTHPVGEKKPNAWGLYDMLGNVWEWCQDRYGSYPSGTVTDPTGPSSGSDRMFRGGGWGDGARGLRVSNRGSYYPNYTDDDNGFRCVRER